MKSGVRVATIVGARPQFIKAAPVSWVIRDRDLITEHLVYTGQHHDADMAGVFLHELDLPRPSHSLDVHGGTHGQMTGRMLEAIEPALSEIAPDVVLVYGDTNSTVAGALAAVKLGLPVAHVEAGLRSFRRFMPEEINRVVTDHISSWLFCPTTEAVTNLRNEGVTEGVFNVGDVMYDVAIRMGERAERDSVILKTLGLEVGSYSVATVHRAENTDDPDQLRLVFDYLRDHVEGRVVLPMHPRTEAAARTHGLPLDDFLTTNPVGYLDMTRLVRSARCVYTDSGGLQKEAYFHRVPCVTLRDETEWVETIECGWNRLWTIDEYEERREISEYGNGHAAEGILDLLTASVGSTE